MKTQSKSKELMPHLRIGNLNCNRSSPTLMIAEEGQANQGDPNLALKMIELAQKCGADGIDFQLSIASRIYISSHEGYRIYKKREFSQEIIKELISEAHTKNMIFQATCLSEELIEVASKFDADVLVINAMDLNNPRMLDTIALTGKPFFISTLMGTLEEIDWAVEFVLARKAKNFALLHGQHIMASQENDAVPTKYTQLDCIPMLEQRYGVPVGFVDHTNSEIMPAIATSRGAFMVTKHLSPRANWKGPDWQICLNPSAWKRAQTYVQLANETKGDNKRLSLEEVADRSLTRRSIVAARNIPKGKILEEADIEFKRPGGGLNPRDYKMYLGKRVKSRIRADQLIKTATFEKK